MRADAGVDFAHRGAVMSLRLDDAERRPHRFGVRRTTGLGEV
jgi:hypothetical protein